MSYVINFDSKPLVVLTGPTAVGKTALSIELAKTINGQIISADSMQVYRNMDIGTAKVTKEEMQGVKHYLIDVLNPDEAFNVAEFVRMAKEAIEEIYANGCIPIIAGGTGFYIQALLKDVNFDNNEHDSESDSNDDAPLDKSIIKYREELNELVQAKGNEYLHNMLKNVDAESADAIHPNNVKRVIRALEYYHLYNEPISEHNKREKVKSSPYNYCYFVLNNDRKIVYDRIDRRIDIMLEQGLVDEVKKLKEAGYTKELVSMQGLGYKEILDYFDGVYTLDEAVNILKRDTRHFAKRQLTWFRRESDVIWIDYQQYKDTKACLNKIISDLLESDIIKEI